MKTFTLKPGTYSVPAIAIQLTPNDVRRGGEGVYEAKLRVTYPDGSHQFVTEKFKIVIEKEL